MFRYEICNQADNEIFEKQCSVLEKNIPDLIRKERLQDVDGSETQLYRLKQFNVRVHNSVYLNEVYIESETDLTQYFR